MTFTDFIAYFQFVVMILTFLLAAKTWFRIKGRRTKFIKENGEIVIGVDVASKGINIDIEKYFPDIKKKKIIEIPKTLVTEKDFDKAAKQIISNIMKYKNNHIHLCLACPSALAIIIGQFIGYNIYSIQVYHFDNESRSYIIMPADLKDWANRLSLNYSEDDREEKKEMSKI